MASENRRRQRMVPIRLSDEEYERLKDKADAVGVTVPAYLRELALRGRVRSPLIDREGALEIGRQIRAIGNNLNQLAKKANEGAAVVHLGEVLEEVHEIRRRLNSLQRNQPTGL